MRRGSRGAGGSSSWPESTVNLSPPSTVPPAFSGSTRAGTTPYVALLTQGVVAVLLTFLATVGTSVQNAYLFFADLTTILAFIPYLYMFASCIALRRETHAAGSIPIPGGSTGNVLVNVSGFLMTALAIVLSCIPPAEETRKLLRVVLLVGGAAGFLAVGFLLYVLASRRARRAEATSSL